MSYFIPEAQHMLLKNGMQQGKWSKINFNQSGETISLPVFNFSLSHGVNPNGVTYAYYVLPGIASPASLAAYDTKSVRVLCNEATRQAVYNEKLDILQVIFWAPGAVKCGTKTVEADVPCVVMVKAVGSDKPEIVLTDPTQKSKLTAGKEVRIVQSNQ